MRAMLGLQPVTLVRANHLLKTAPCVRAITTMKTLKSVRATSVI